MYYLYSRHHGILQGHVLESIGQKLYSMFRAERNMDIHIELDTDLVNEALRVSGCHTNKELINTALKEFIANHSVLDIRKIRGQVAFAKGYNYKTHRY
jgi:hypothetical protein